MTGAAPLPTLSAMDQPPGAPELGLAELLEALVSPDPAVRARALLRARPSPGTEDVLIEALADPDPEVRRAAVHTLGRGDGPKAAQALMEVSAGDVSVAVRAEAVAALGRILQGRFPREEGGVPGDPSPR